MPESPTPRDTFNRKALVIPYAAASLEQKARLDAALEKLARDPANVQAACDFGRETTEEYKRLGERLLQLQKVNGRMLAQLDTLMVRAQDTLSTAPREAYGMVRNALEKFVKTASDSLPALGEAISETAHLQGEFIETLREMSLYAGVLPDLLLKYDQVYIPQAAGTPQERDLVIARNALSGRAAMIEGAQAGGALGASNFGDLVSDMARRREMYTSSVREFTGYLPRLPTPDTAPAPKRPTAP